MSIKLKPLSEQVVVITGASSGIGLVTAEAAARRGARVLLISRNAEALQAAVHRIQAAGGRAEHAVADVGEIREVRAAAAKAIARWGRIDTWVNDAGVSVLAKLTDTPAAEHERMFKTNYFGVVNGSLVAMQHLRHGGGAIVTVASIAADLPTPMLGAYAATKHAVKAFVQTLRLEAKADGLPVSITLVKPSGIDTPFAEHESNHAPGQAVIPQLAYDPQLVADAILDSAEHPRREITVGGFGRMQALVGLHFPALLETTAGLLTKMTYRSGRPNISRSNLFVSQSDGRQQRSGRMMARRTSLYTTAKLHPLASTLGLVATAAIGIVLLQRRKG